MGQEFFINSQKLEDEVRKLLPSQGGSGAGFDLSASTQIIPIIDLTETAEGTGLRQDLQKSFSFADTTSFSVNNVSDQVIINATGYWLVQFGLTMNGTGECSFNLFDGSSAKKLFESSGTEFTLMRDEFMVFLSAGDSLRGTASVGNSIILGSFKQIASIDGTLTIPS